MEWNEMYEAAKSVLNERRISEHVTYGEVSAAIYSKSRKIYTGVCIDTCSTLGICAERNAIFNKITSSEQEIEKFFVFFPMVLTVRLVVLVENLWFNLWQENIMI